jgi:hypothetical protein
MAQARVSKSNFVLSDGTAGTQVNYTVSHTDTANAASHAAVEIVTGGASGGDPFIHFDVTGGTDWAAGVDNSDSDKFKISSNATLGTNDRVTITSTGQVGIAQNAPVASALVEMVSTTQGLLLPRMTEAQRDLIATPAAGLLIYNTTSNKLDIRVAAAWEEITSA